MLINHAEKARAKSLKASRRSTDDSWLTHSLHWWTSNRFCILNEFWQTEFEMKKTSFRISLPVLLPCLVQQLQWTFLTRVRISKEGFFVSFVENNNSIWKFDDGENLHGPTFWITTFWSQRACLPKKNLFSSHSPYLRKCVELHRSQKTILSRPR